VTTLRHAETRAQATVGPGGPQTSALEHGEITCLRAKDGSRQRHAGRPLAFHSAQDAAADKVGSAARVGDT